MTSEKILHLLSQQGEHIIGSRVLALDCVDSTNALARELAGQGEAQGLAVVSREQTGGRGRRGRSFQSVPGGLYLSVLLRPELPPQQVADFTAWTAVAVCDGIQSACGVRPRIKWTNDLVLGDKKLCGILTELGLDQKTWALDHLVVGIGVNVNQREQDFHQEVRDIATSLSAYLGRPVDLEELCAHILHALDEMYAVYPQGRQRYLEQYRADCLTIGRPVRLITPAAAREAFAAGIDEEFRLVVQLPDGTTEAVATGEASVRGMYGYI